MQLIVVVHFALLPIKKYYGHSQLCPFVSIAVTHPGYCGEGVGLSWDDDAEKSKIMRFGCECRCLRRMKGLSKS